MTSPFICNTKAMDHLQIRTDHEKAPIEFKMPYSCKNTSPDNSVDFGNKHRSGKKRQIFVKFRYTGDQKVFAGSNRRSSQAKNHHEAETKDKIVAPGDCTE